MGPQLFGPTSNTSRPKPHDLLSILPDLEDAANDIEQELQKLEKEEASLLESIRQTVGNMSDLRYGRLANPNLKNEVLDGLQGLQDICKQKS